MNVYWLSRDGSSAAEGPYALGQLRNFYQRGEVTALAQVCLHGSDSWLPLHEELEHDEDMERQLKPAVSVLRREKSLEQVLRERDAESVKTWGNVAGALMILTGLASLVPFFGLLTWFAYGLVSLICTVLAVLMMVKGAVGRGIMTIGLAWIGLPLVMVILQMAVHAIFL